MPAGVATDFLRILDVDQRARGIRFWILLGLAVVLFGPAWILYPLWGLAVHVGAIALGALIGWPVSRLVAKRYELGMKTTWKDWMRFSLAGESVADVHRRAAGRSSLSVLLWMALGIAVLWAVELLLFTLALMDSTAVWWSTVVIAVNGLVVGLLAMQQVLLRKWTRQLRASIRAMLDEGEIGAWGVRG